MEKKTSNTPRVAGEIEARLQISKSRWFRNATK
jgi:hypothetical protein